jgi:hypothetical protein
MRKKILVVCLVSFALCSLQANAATRVLFIASSYGAGNGPFTANLTPALTSAGYDVRIWTQATMGWPRLDTLLTYDCVFFHGSERNKMGLGIDSTLTNYALQGGRLITEGTNVAQWAGVFHEMNKRVTHVQFMGANAVGYATHIITDPSNLLMYGLQSPYQGTYYHPQFTPDQTVEWAGGHTVVRYGSSTGAPSIIVYPRAVFFCESIAQIRPFAVRDSLLVRSVRWVIRDPVDASLYDIDYELGHRPGQIIPVNIKVKNWNDAGAAGELTLEASIDSVNWSPQDSTVYSLGSFALQSYTLYWSPTTPAHYYLRGVIRPTGTDEIADDNTMGLRVMTLAAPTHPHMFFAASDVTELRNRAATTHANFANALRQYVDANINYALPSPQAWWTLNIVEFASVFENAAMQAVLNPTPTYINAAKRFAMMMVRYPHWATSQAAPDQDLEAARACFALSLAYDWLYDQFTPAEQDSILGKLKTQLERLDAAYNQYVWWSMAPIHNHHWASNDYLGTGALAIADEEPMSAAWHQRAITSLNLRMGYYGAVTDGSWYESMNYWGAISWSLLHHLYVLRQYRGMDYFNQPFVRSLPIYRIYGSLPNFGLLMMENESQLSEWYGPEEQLALLAREYRDGEAQWYQARIIQSRGFNLRSPFYIIFYDPTVAEQPPATLSKLIPDQDTYFSRSDWTANGTFFYLKCGLPGGRHAYQTFWSPGGAVGAYDFSHFDPDQNGFNLYYNGRYIIQSAGRQNPVQYTRNSATVLINGQGQIGDGMKGFWPLPANKFSMNPHIAEASATHHTDYVVGDATTSYTSATGLTQFLRGVLYIRPSTFWVVDRLAASTPSTFSFWLRNVHNVWTWNSSRVLINDGPAQMTMSVLEPASWTAGTRYDVYDEMGSTGYGLNINNAVPDTALHFSMVFQPVSGSEALVQNLGSNKDFVATRILSPTGQEIVAMVKFNDSLTVTLDSLRTDAALAVVQRTGGQLTSVTLKQASFADWGADFPQLYSSFEPKNLEWDYHGDTLALADSVGTEIRIWAPLANIVTIQGNPIGYQREGSYVIINDLVPPISVSGLIIVYSTQGATLYWPRVHVDTDGNPVTISRYLVYAQTSLSEPAVHIGDVSPTDSVYVDTQSLDPTHYWRFYQVVAERSIN